MEIEIRAKIKNQNEIKKKLQGLGAKLIKDTKQIDKYFGEMSLYRKIGYSFLMRVRKEGNKTFLTYKGAKMNKDGIWEEYEFSINDSKAAEAMLKDMGLEKITEIRKKRTEYKLNGLTICLDAIEGLGNFVEIESKTNNSLGKNKLEMLAKKLNIEKDQIVHKGYLTMLLSKNKSPYSKYIVN